MHTDTIKGYYGSGKTPCLIFTATSGNGMWYAVEGSQNVLCTYEDLTDGVWVEEVEDCNAFTWPHGVDSEEELITAIEA